MTLTTRTAKGSPLTHAELDANWTHVLDSSNGTFVQSGTGAIARDSQSKLRERLTPEDNGLVGDGVTVNTAADMLQLFANAVAQKKAVDFRGNVYVVGGTIALTAAHANLTLLASGIGGITKGFNGNLMTVAACQNFRCHGVYFNGVHGTYTGKGIVFSGASHYPVFDHCDFSAFTSSHIEYGADSGYRAKHTKCDFHLAGAQTDPACIIHTGIDSGAMHRVIEDCGADGHHDCSGAFDTYISKGSFTDVITDANSFGTHIEQATWASSGAATATLMGQVTMVTGTRIAKSAAIDSGATNYVFVGNVQTAGTFTDSPSTGLVGQVVHRAPAGVEYIIGKHLLNVNETVPCVIQAYRGNFPGNADTSYVVGGSGNVIIDQSPLTANRTTTLGTTNARDGTRVTSVRQVAASGAFYRIVGTRSLRPGEKVTHQYDGSAYQDLDPLGPKYLQWLAVAYSASITIDATLGDIFDITATNGTAFTINAPTSPFAGQRITITIENTSGGALGVITWNAVFKMIAFTSPTNGNNCSITFYYNGTNWRQETPQSLQIPN